MSEGWVKLHREMKNHPIFANPPLYKVWCWCLLRAKFKTGYVYHGMQKIFLDSGQFIYGRKKASQELKLAESSVRNYMDFLTGIRHYSYRFQDRELDIEPRDGFSIVTIRNWQKYQGEGQEEGQEKDNKRTQTRRVKKENTIIAPNANSRSEQEITTKSQLYFNFDTKQWDNLCPDDIKDWQEAYPACDVEIELNCMRQWLLSNPSKRKKNYRRFVTNWLGRQQDKGGTHKGKVKQDPYDLTTMEMKNK